MEVVIAKPANKEQMDAVKAILKSLHVDFTTENEEYSPGFLKKMERAEKQIKSGNYRKVAAGAL